MPAAALIFYPRAPHAKKEKDLFIALVFIFIALVFILVLASVPRDILIVIPIFLHEVDWLAASIVLLAVFAPILGVAGRHMQVKWLTHHAYRNCLDDHGCRVDERRLREVADVYAAI